MARTHEEFTSRFDVLWPNGSYCPREYIYGLTQSQYWQDSPANKGFRRSPFLKTMDFTLNGTTAATWLVTSNFTMNDSNAVRRYIHPVLDPTWGVCAYGLNISSPLVPALENLPTVSATITQGYQTAVNKAIAWWMEGTTYQQEYLLFMPDELTSTKIKGPLYDTFDSYLHLRNSVADINTNLVYSTTGKWSYYHFANNWICNNSSVFTDRFQVTVKPSFFAVVACYKCTPVGVAQNWATSLYNQYGSGQYPPYMKDDGTNNIVCFSVRIATGEPYIDQAVNVKAGSQSVVDEGLNVLTTRVREIYDDNNGYKVYFCWMEPAYTAGSGISTWTQSLIVTPPILVIRPNRESMSTGDTLYARILQYGVEFNL